MDLAFRIAECQTIAELSTLERLYLLNEVEQRILFERKLEIFRRITEWRVENEQLGIVILILRKKILVSSKKLLETSKIILVSIVRILF
jgi:hypothetical protein